MWFPILFFQPLSSYSLTPYLVCGFPSQFLSCPTPCLLFILCLASLLLVKPKLFSYFVIVNDWWKSVGDETWTCFGPYWCGGSKTLFRVKCFGAIHFWKVYANCVLICEFPECSLSYESHVCEFLTVPCDRSTVFFA